VTNRAGSDFLSVGAQSSQGVDFTDRESVPLSFFHQGAPGSFDPTAIDPSKLIIVWGSDSGTETPDPLAPETKVIHQLLSCRGSYPPNSESSSDDAIHQRRALELRDALRKRDWNRLGQLLGGSDEPANAQILFARARKTLPTPWLRRILPEFLELAGENAVEFDSLGQTCFQVECLAVAEQCYRRALVLEPSRFRSLLGSANDLESQGTSNQPLSNNERARPKWHTD